MFERRLGIVYFAICAGILCIGARLFQLQVLQMTAEDPDAVLRRPLPLEEIPVSRGAILDRHGEVLAADQPTLELAVQYRELLRLHALRGGELTPWEAKQVRRAELKNPAASASVPDPLRSRLEALSYATGRDHDYILAQTEAIVRRVRRVREAVPGPRELYEETIPHVLISDISIETAARVSADEQRYPGVVVQAAYRRSYPLGKVASHVVGYLRKAQRPQRGEVPEDPTVRSGEWIGYTGAEKQFDPLLRGVPGIVNTGPDPKTGRLRQDILFPAQAGHNVYLSLSLSAQRRAEEALAGKVGAVVVMDVRTGELLVLATSPSFDPATGPAEEDLPLHPYLSRAIQDSVPPGSVFKPAVALAAAASGISPEREFTCNGVLKVGGIEFHCEGQHGAVNMETAIAQSCNVYFWEVARKVGPEAILRWASVLNLGRKTGVDLPYEKAGRLPVLSARWPVGKTLNLGIGQGDLSATPLQVVAMMTEIGNGGPVPRPTILHRIEPPPEDEPENAPGAPPQSNVPLPADGLRAVRAGMWQATLSGTASRVSCSQGLRELKAAVKTGTAQTKDPTLNQDWIAGYMPWNAPRWAFAVVVHNSPGHGAAVAGPIAVAVLESLTTQPPGKLVAGGGPER